ncbi:MAG: hypothetical protein WHS38_12400, partial [Thermodesulforhabdaceae bacterium]
MLETLEQKRQPNTMALAMVALYEPLLPCADHYHQCLEQNFPDLPQPTSVAFTEKDNLQAMSVEIGENEGIIALMPVPIPWSDLEGPCLTA